MDCMSASYILRVAILNKTTEVAIFTPSELEVNDGSAQMETNIMYRLQTLNS